MFRSKIPEVDVESRSPVPKVPAQFSAKRNGGSPWNNGKHSQTGGFYVGISNNDSDETVHKIAVRKPSFFRRFARGAPREATSPDRGELAGSGAAKQWSTKADEGIDGMASEMDRLFSSAGNRLPDQRAEMPPRSSRSPRHGLGIRFGSVDSKGGSEDIRNGAGRRNAAALANLPGGVTSIKSRDFASEQRLSTMRLPADLIGSPFMDDDTISELSRPLAMQMLGERAEAEPASMASSAAEEATPAVSQGSKLTSVQTLGQEQAKATSRHQHLADPVDIPARRSSFSDQTRQMLHKNLGLTEVSPVKPKGSPEMLSVDRTLRNQLDRYNTQVRQGCESIHKAALTAWSQGAADDDGGGGGGGGGRDDSGLEAEGIRQLQNLGLDGSMTRRRCREHLLDLMAHVAHSHLLGESVSTFQGVGLTARETDIVQDVAFKALEKASLQDALLFRAVLLKLQLIASKQQDAQSQAAAARAKCLDKLHDLLSLLLRYAGLGEVTKKYRLVATGGFKHLASARDTLALLVQHTHGIAIGGSIDDAVLQRGLFEVVLASESGSANGPAKTPESANKMKGAPLLTHSLGLTLLPITANSTEQSRREGLSRIATPLTDPMGTNRFSQERQEVIVSAVPSAWRRSTSSPTSSSSPPSPRPPLAAASHRWSD